MANRHDVTKRIDGEIDRMERLKVDITPSSVKKNVLKKLTWGDWDPREAQSEALDARIARRLRDRGYRIADSTPRNGGRLRKGYWDLLRSELEEDLRVKEEGSRFDKNRIKAEKAVLTFLRVQETDLGYEPYAGLFQDDIERIYAMHGFSSPGA